MPEKSPIYNLDLTLPKTEDKLIVFDKWCEKHGIDPVDVEALKNITEEQAQDLESMLHGNE